MEHHVIGALATPVNARVQGLKGRTLVSKKQDYVDCDGEALGADHYNKVMQTKDVLQFCII